MSVLVQNKGNSTNFVIRINRDRVLGFPLAILQIVDVYPLVHSTADDLAWIIPHESNRENIRFVSEVISDDAIPLPKGDSEIVSTGSHVRSIDGELERVDAGGVGVEDFRNGGK